MSPESTWIWVDTPEKIAHAGDALRAGRILCIDTEYDSLRYFREKLCLIQIKNGGTTFLFDPLNGLDLSFLGEVFADERILKILHAGDNDIRILRRDYPFTFRNVFDTYQAALLLGCQQLALATLIHQFLGVSLEKKKKLQRSKWEMRPLKAEQIAYAVADTAYLEPLYRRLEGEIRARGLGKAAEKAFRETEGATWRDRPFRPAGHLRMEGAQELGSEEERRLAALYRWRFRKGEASNRAPFMILSDRDLVRLAKTPVASVEDLVSGAAIPADRATLFGADILRILAGTDTP